MSINLNKWLEFWSPTQERLRGMVVSEAAWDAEIPIHLDMLFSATANPVLRSVLSGTERLRIAEIGVGVGRLAGPLSRRHKVHGLDWSEPMLAECASDAPSVSVHLLTLPSLEWPSLPPIDVAFSFLCLQHIPDEQVIRSYFESAKNVLRPGGVLRIQTLAAQPNRANNPSWHGWTCPTVAELSAEVKAAGLTVTEQVTGLGHPDWAWVTAIRPLGKWQAEP